MSNMSTAKLCKCVLLLPFLTTTLVAQLSVYQKINLDWSVCFVLPREFKFSPSRALSLFYDRKSFITYFVLTFFLQIEAKLELLASEWTVWLSFLMLFFQNRISFMVSIWCARLKVLPQEDLFSIAL